MQDRGLARQFDISELVAAGNNNNAVIVIVAVVSVIMTAGLMVLRGEQPGCFLNRIFRADGAYMVGAAMQALHVSQSIEAAR